jgi:hypothetical protein
MVVNPFQNERGASIWLAPHGKTHIGTAEVFSENGDIAVVKIHLTPNLVEQ